MFSPYPADQGRVKNLIVLSLILFYSCGADEFSDVRKVALIETNDVGIASQTLSISSPPTERCQTLLYQSNIGEIHLYYCKEDSLLEISYLDRSDFSFHLKALSRNEEIIVTDNGTTISAIGDFSFFTSSAFSEEGRTIIKVFLNHERATLMLSHKGTNYSAVNLL
jgi:hypothetical protein